jgi:hypothetical protein
LNDCLWYLIEICDGLRSEQTPGDWIRGCEVDTDGRCQKYLSRNTEESDRIAEQYTEDVKNALIPVRQKYRVKYL